MTRTEVWVLGATGQGGSAIARELVASAVDVVLVGRSGRRLDRLAGELAVGDRRPGTRVVPDLAGLPAALVDDPPAVLVNTVGPFVHTGPLVARACLAAGVHYVDLTNEVDAAVALLGLHDEAVRVERAVVVGAGFGVVATEALALRLRGDRPAAERVRVAAMPTVESSGAGVLATVVESVAAGGRVQVGGVLVRRPLGWGFEHTPLPDGTMRGTIAVPTGEILAAARATGAADAVAASSEIPTGRAVRLALPVVGRLLAIGPVRRALVRFVERRGITLPGSAGDTSWAHARLEWADGSTAAGWLRAGEGYVFTARVAARVAALLARGGGRPGAATPAALFGPDLALAAGAEFVLDTPAVPEGTP